MEPVIRHKQELKTDGVTTDFDVVHNFDSMHVYLEFFNIDTYQAYFPGPGFIIVSPSTVRLHYKSAPPAGERIMVIVTPR